MKQITALLIIGGLFSPLCSALNYLPERGLYKVPVKSFQEMKFGDVHRQQYDFSCGSAALATLLTYHYDTPSYEGDIFAAMFEKGNKEIIKQKGFSLLDMKAYLADLGFNSDGFKVNIDTIRKVGVPGITLVNFDGYMHFVVIKGMNSSSIILGDPSRGTMMMSFEEFEQYYQGIVLLIRNHANIGKQTFITDDKYAIHQKAPVERGVSRESLGVISITLPQAGDY
ncbi:C39 family peptidase [Vibrio maerlii]|uniref:C39 family peptidase n=1 Tax=Vibrio maerlii TaxID=2231648 RepID=UPI000E3EA8E9|nr:C39 family peptidase [Vibrio maerlii]